MRGLGSRRPVLEDRPDERDRERWRLRPVERRSVLVSDSPVAPGIQLRLRPPGQSRTRRTRQLLPASTTVPALIARRFPRPGMALAAAVLLLGGAACRRREAPSPAPKPATPRAASATFVGRQACAPCHAAEEAR